ncbi:MAG: hypothetical protein AAGC55_13120, partial [Myxococcota bacterium]
MSAGRSEGSATEPAQPGRAVTDVPSGGDGCRRAFDIVDARDWAAWTGLPGDCAVGQVERCLPGLSEAHGRGHLGLTIVPTEFRTAPHDSGKKPLRVWYRDAYVVAVDIPYPRLDGGPERLAAALGSPADLLDYYQGAVLYQRSAAVYPDRGIAELDDRRAAGVIQHG